MENPGEPGRNKEGPVLRKDPVEVPADKLCETGLHGRVVEQWVPPITLDRAQLHGKTNTAARGERGLTKC